MQFKPVLDQCLQPPKLSKRELKLEFHRVNFDPQKGEAGTRTGYLLQSG